MTAPIHTAYIDESQGDGYYWFLAAVVTPAVETQLRKAWVELTDDLRVKYGLTATPEIHAYDIFHGKGPWRGMHARQRVSVFHRALGVIEAHKPKLVVVRIDEAGFYRRYWDVFSLRECALTLMFEQLDILAEEIGCRIELIVDEGEGQKAANDALGEYKLHGTFGFRHSKLDNLVQPISFVDSSQTPLIQVADLILYVLRRFSVKGGKDKRELRELIRMRAKISPLIARHRYWQP